MIISLFVKFRVSKLYYYAVRTCVRSSVGGTQHPFRYNLTLVITNINNIDNY